MTLVPPLHLVATCALGLEEFVAAELTGLGVEPAAREPGGVSFDGTWSTVCRTNLWLRTANRVLVELARFPAGDGDALWRAGGDLVRSVHGEWFDPDRTFAVQATVTRSPIRDTRWAALRFKDGVVDAQRERWGRRASIDGDDPVLPLRLRLQGESGAVLLDTTGEPLDRRGYRALSVGAPARETLATACVLASGWDGQGPVVDPMCGTGTMLAEAGWFALGWPPSLLRPSFAFERFPDFDPALLAAERDAVPTSPAPDVALFGGDRSLTALGVTRRNLAAARLDGRARLVATLAGDFAAPRGRPGLLLVNPPHGERLAADSAQWRALGDLMKRRFAGWRAVVLAGGPGLGKEIGLKPRRRIPVRNGPLEGRILVFDLY